MTTNSQDHIPKVSIGMPVYNGEKFIRKALDSLLAQTFTNFELIISDNASTDATGRICQQYSARDQRLQYIRQPLNRGPKANFQFVLDKAQAEYFMWAAADDWWHQNFILKCKEVLDHNTMIDVAWPKFIVVSRKYPILKMSYFPDMTFLSSDDPFTRIANFILMKEPSHKANLVYGLWRRPVIRRMVNAFEDADSRLAYFGLDIAMIVYALASSKALQIPEFLFIKSYEGIPPGCLVTTIRRLLKHYLQRNRVKEKQTRDSKDFVWLLNLSLRRAGIYNECYTEILSIKMNNDVERFFGLKNMIKELRASLKAELL